MKKIIFFLFIFIFTYSAFAAKMTHEEGERKEIKEAKETKQLKKTEEVNNIKKYEEIEKGNESKEERKIEEANEIEEGKEEEGEIEEGKEEKGELREGNEEKSEIEEGKEIKEEKKSMERKEDISYFSSSKENSLSSFSSFSPFAQTSSSSLSSLFSPFSSFLPFLSPSSVLSSFTSPVFNITWQILTKQKLDTKSAAYSFIPLPLPIKGCCTKGKVYTITSLLNLYELIDEIECVWTAGLAPTSVPLGANYGRLLAFTNTAFLDYLSEFVYQGDYVVQTQCGGKYLNVGVLKFLTLGESSTGVWSVSSLPKHMKLMNGEHYEGEEGVLMDFTVNIEELCAIEGNERTSSFSHANFFPFRSSPYPFKLFIDMLRLVGFDTDGCALLLGRSWMKMNANKETPTWGTILFFTLKSCDESIIPNFFKKGDSLPPLPKSFVYERGGITEFFKGLNPLEYLLFEEKSRRNTAKRNSTNGLFNYKEKSFFDSKSFNVDNDIINNVHSIKTEKQKSKYDNHYEKIFYEFWNNPVLQAWRNLFIASTQHGF